jgi:hypothetical protein
MVPYFLVFAPIAMMAVTAKQHRTNLLLWSVAFLMIVVFVGLRHRVGMDWNNYLVMIQQANVGGWLQSFSVAEPGYATLLWISGQLGWGVYGAYLIGTLVFAAGLFRYARITPYPWLALTVAMPFLVTVVAMSAARQAVAIGIILWLVAVWSKTSLLRRIFLICLASTFHFSAMGFLVLAVLDLRAAASIKLIGAVILGITVLFVLSTSGQLEYYNDSYGTGQTELTRSSGAFIHTMLNGAPAALAFLLGHQYRSALLPNPLHRQMGVIAILLVVLSLFMSTAAGRMSLYFFPVSMMVCSSLPTILSDGTQKLLVRGLVAVGMLILMSVWLLFGNSAIAYQRYQNAIFIDPDKLVLCCD